MKLDNKNIIVSGVAGRFGGNRNAKQNSNPFLNKNTHFTGDFTRIVDKVGKSITYSNMDKISANIDNVLGDNFFSKTLEKAKLTITDNKLQIPNPGIGKDILSTLKYPFVDLLPDLINSMTRGMKKVSFLKGLGNKIQSLPLLKDGLQKRAGAKEVERSLELVNEIMENFANQKAGAKIQDGLKFNFENCAENFKSKVASNVTKLAKNYSSRDERTLNRMITATVSAIYGGWDFHNISMLQKDNKKEAKKAGKGRFKQEMTRMLFNAGTTFLTLGALNKYIKNSMFLSVSAIAISALLSEVVSRIIHKKPLHTLSPEEAEKIALKQHPELAKTLDNQNKAQAKARVNFKQKLEDTNKIFVQFQSHDGRFPAMKCLDDDFVAKSKNRKKTDPKKIILGIFGLASAGYIISSALKGDFAYKKAVKKLYDKFGDNTPKEQIEKLIGDRKSANKKFSIFKPVKKFLTTKKATVELDKLNSKLEDLQKTESGEKIKNTLSDYMERIGEVAKDGNEYAIRKPSVIRTGLYNGFSRLFDNVYTVLSLPARLFEAVLDNTVYKKSNKFAEAIEARMIEKPKMEDVITSLDGILNKAKNKESAVDEITRATRKFASGPETGKLAGLARTLVTAISTYFFVNDYTNSVMIESAGKDTQRAKAERNERLAHKGANFVINGTLMNLFNSIFVKQLNGSLLGATLVAGATETTNEFLVRKSICQPVLPKNSRQEIIDYEQKQLSRKGILGSWSRFFKKVTGKKSLTQKTGINNNNKKS